MKCSMKSFIGLLGLITVKSTNAFSAKTGSYRTRILLHGRSSIPSVAKSLKDMTSSIPTRLFTVASSGTAASDASSEHNERTISTIYGLAGIASALAWIATAYVALSFHPDPRFADCTLRHNLLTMGQAFAFPLPVAWASFEALRQSAKESTLNSKTSRRLNLGIAAASLWLACSSAIPKAFAFGYDLYSVPHKIAVSVIHATTGVFALRMATRSTSAGEIIRGTMGGLWNIGPTTSNGSPHKNSSCYATGVVGLLYFAIQPIVALYPLATVPTILGKRLSRPASAFTLLGAVVAYCLKETKTPVGGKEQSISDTLRAGLAWGTAGHLLLILLKLIGVDGGGLIFPGRGLWEVYPAMIAVPFATGVSLAVHAILCFAAWTDDR